jgi:threonine aldolase
MGGRVWPLDRLTGVLGVAAEHRLRSHLDGARLLNAVVASGVPASEWAAPFDTAWIDFTKGLGAPLGACLAGSQELIEEAWRWKQMMGGSMRQAGIVAAGALHALDHHVDRLADDHALARVLADGLAEIPGVTLDPALVETNIVVFRVADAFAASEALKARDVWIGALDATTLRAVTHLDADRAGVEIALRAVREVLA